MKFCPSLSIRCVDLQLTHFSILSIYGYVLELYQFATNTISIKEESFNFSSTTHTTSFTYKYFVQKYVCANFV